MLRLPDRYRQIAVWRRWRAGTIPAIHCVFRHLASPCAFVFEALTSVPTLSGQIATAAAVSRRATIDALRELAEHGLAEYVPPRGDEPGGWTTGPVSLDAAGRVLDAPAREKEIDDRYRDERHQYREQLVQFERAFHGTSPTQDPAPDLAAELADLLAQTEPPQQRQAASNTLPDHIPDPGGYHTTEPGPLDWITPEHEAAMQALADLGATHPMVDKLRERGPKDRSRFARRARGRAAPQPIRRRTAPQPIRRRTTAGNPPLVPMPADQQAALAAADPALQLLIDQLGAVILQPEPPP
jgi:hypothetical protein